MSAFAAVTLKNNAGSDVVFSPLSIDTATGVASYGTSDTVFDAKSVLTISTKTPGTKSSRARMKIKVSIPIMDATVTTLKVDECIVNVDYSLPRNATSTMRLDLRGYIKAAVADAVSTAFLTSFEGIY